VGEIKRVKMKINLIPKPIRKETVDKLKIANFAFLKLALHHAKLEIAAQDKLIKIYKAYFDFMESPNREFN